MSTRLVNYIDDRLRRSRPTADEDPLEPVNSQEMIRCPRLPSQCR